MSEPIAGVWIEGLAATWDVDDEGERFTPEAFDAGIKAFLAEAPVLAYHHAHKVVETPWGSSKVVQIGQVTELSRESESLRMKAWIPRPEHGGFLANVFELIRSGMMRGLSVGGLFERVGKRIVRAALREISVAPRGINPKALITRVTPAFEVPDLSARGVAIGTAGKAVAGTEDLTATLALAEFAAGLRDLRGSLAARRERVAAPTETERLIDSLRGLNAYFAGAEETAAKLRNLKELRARVARKHELATRPSAIAESRLSDG